MIEIAKLVNINSYLYLYPVHPLILSIFSWSRTSLFHKDHFACQGLQNTVFIREPQLVKIDPRGQRRCIEIHAPGPV